MSVERIAPVRQESLDGSTGRVGVFSAHSAAQNAAPFSPAAFPTPAAEGLGALFDSLSLPLPSITPGAGDALISPRAPYAKEAAELELALLSAGRLPSQAVVAKAAAMLRAAAAERDATIEAVIDRTAVVEIERTPSRNRPSAQSAFRESFAARDENGDIEKFDLHLTRVGARQWEAVVFRCDETAAAFEFPYPTPPISVDRLVIDPSNGLILACVAQQIAPRFEAQSTAFLAIMRAITFAVAIVAATIIIWNTLSKSIAIVFFVTVIALAIRIPSDARRIRDGLPPSRRSGP